MEIHAQNSLETTKSVKEIELSIIEKILEIESKFPELTKYLNEMPVQQNPKINTKSLQEYAESLEAILNNYAISHK
jgi:hypothetical protein